MFFVFIQVLRDFKQPDGWTEKEVDAAGDGEVLITSDGSFYCSSKTTDRN